MQGRVGLLTGLKTLICGVLRQPCQMTYLKVQSDSPGQIQRTQRVNKCLPAGSWTLAGGDGESVGRYL